MFLIFQAATLPLIPPTIANGGDIDGNDDSNEDDDANRVVEKGGRKESKEGEAEHLGYDNQLDEDDPYGFLRALE